jgi:acyl dehydratase
MVEVEYPSDMQQYVGKPLGTSEWVTIDQEKIDGFAKITGDESWIHIDTERAKRELPEGKTIAHGLLTMSLMTHLGTQTFRIRRRGKAINYGSNKVRFPAPVLCGARLRLHRTLEKVEPMDGAVRLIFSNTMEIEGQQRPAMVAESITVIYEAAPA